MAKDDVREIHQHPEGHHIVRVDDKVYVDTPENFKNDFGVELPVMPIGIDERVYHQGVRHALYRNNSVVDGGPMPWSMGDSLFAKINHALNKQKKRVDDDFDARTKRVNDETKEMEKDIKRKIKQTEEEHKIVEAQLRVQHESKNNTLRTKGDKDIKAYEEHKKAKEKEVENDIKVKQQKMKDINQLGMELSGRPAILLSEKPKL